VNKDKYLGKQRRRRKSRVRKKVRGTADCPRLNVFRSHKHLACQLIDDSAGTTLVAVSTYEPKLHKKVSYGGNCDAAKLIGKELGERALEAGIKQVRFDRGPARYLGRVSILADAARETGLKL
jgi:large subunit ribosomal protein L18